MDLSIIIVNWNTRDLLAQCLTSVYAHPPEGEFEVFVVDNASTDGSTRTVRERFPQVTLIENGENVGFALANNQAIRRSQGRAILLLNSDTVVLAGALEKMFNFMVEHPEAGIVGPTLLNPDHSFQASHADFPSVSSEALLLMGLARSVYSPYFPSYPPSLDDAPRQVDWVGGACLMARREAVADVGMLDEGYFMYAEEMDWCYRMRAKGWDVCYLPQARVIHVGGQSIGRRSGTKRTYLYNGRIRFFRKHYGPLQTACLKAMLSISSFARVLHRLLFCSLGARRSNVARQELGADLQLIRDCWL